MIFFLILVHFVHFVDSVLQLRFYIGVTTNLNGVRSTGRTEEGPPLVDIYADLVAAAGEGTTRGEMVASDGVDACALSAASLGEALVRKQQEINDMRKQFAKSTRNSADSEAYCCWELQQTNLNLALILVTDIPMFIHRNATKGRELFEGALWPQPVGESSKSPVDERGKGKAWEPRREDDSDEE
ncbi:hypothetical protein PIB30_087225 [Stylosanthes scabra]|uniref:Uncharacterized protein n=1 Tax=Stylosanthes scabra TaxID=79078 RepID=A0ABU6TUS8_9FABA|nr:hypothetical protein [Stylosanthes scabra]